MKSRVLSKIFSLQKKSSFLIQLFTLLIIMFTINYLIYLYFFKAYYTNQYKNLIHKEITLIKEILIPAIRPYFIIEDFATIEKYFSVIVEKTNIDLIEIINNKGRPLFAVILEKGKAKLVYKPLFKREIGQEKWKEDSDYIYLITPIPGASEESVLGWLYLSYSKRDFKTTMWSNYLFTILLISFSIPIFFIIIKYFIRTLHHDLKILTHYLLSIPHKKGEHLPTDLHSFELNQLKNIAENLSKLLYDQERQILQEKYKLEEILSSLTEGVVFTNHQLEIFYYNPPFLTLVGGWSSEDILRKRLYELFPLKEKDRKSDFWENLKFHLKLKEENLLSRHLNFDELYYQTPDGKTRIIEASIVSLENELIEGFLFIFRDITHRKIIEREIQRIQKFEALDKLAGGVAHDLRNLLAGLYNYFHILKLKIKGIDPSFKNNLERIERLLERASALSAQLLSLSKAGVPVKKASDIEELLREVAEFCFSGFPVEVEFILHVRPGKLLFDPHQMAQVFQNIFINAREAMPNGGKVTIEISVKELVEGEIPQLPKGKYLSISISDTGTGIPPDVLPFIFDPFFTTKEGGTGLGLTVAFQVVRHHGGHITVSSEPTKGSKFIIYLPFEEAKELAEILQPKVDKKIVTKKILVIDDEEDIRETLKIILSEYGYNIKTAASGQEALHIFKEELAKNEPFEIVIMDFTLPDLSGDKLLINLKEIYSNFIAILSTGYADIPVVSEYKLFGFDKILLKPYTLDDLFFALG